MFRVRVAPPALLPTYTGPSTVKRFVGSNQMKNISLHTSGSILFQYILPRSQNWPHSFAVQSHRQAELPNHSLEDHCQVGIENSLDAHDRKSILDVPRGSVGCTRSTLLVVQCSIVPLKLPTSPYLSWENLSCEMDCNGNYFNNI